MAASSRRAARLPISIRLATEKGRRLPTTEVLRLTTTALISGSRTWKRAKYAASNSACISSRATPARGRVTRMRCVWPRNCMSAECSTTVSAISWASRALTASPRALLREDARDVAHVEAVERRVERIDEILAQIGDETAERVGEAGPGRHHDLRQAELAGERDGMQGTGAAEGEEREVARVVAAGQRHHADRAGHVGVGEPDRGRGGV